MPTSVLINAPLPIYAIVVCVITFTLNEPAMPTPPEVPAPTAKSVGWGADSGSDERARARVSKGLVGMDSMRVTGSVVDSVFVGLKSSIRPAASPAAPLPIAGNESVRTVAFPVVEMAVIVVSGRMPGPLRYPQSSSAPLTDQEKPNRLMRPCSTRTSGCR